MFRKEGTHKGHVTDTQKTWLLAQEARSEQLLKASLPTLLTELIPLDQEAKGEPGREADLLSLPHQ